MNDVIGQLQLKRRTLEPRVERVRTGSWLQLPPPGKFAWTRVNLPIPSLPQPLEGLRIIHLADVHIRRHWSRAYDELLSMLRANPPELILFTGDLVENRLLREHEVESARRLVDGLASRLGIFGIFGNHDGDFLAHRIIDGKMVPIENTVVTLASPDAVIELIGLPGVFRGDLDEEFLNRIPDLEEPGVRIVLSHYPDQLPQIERLHADIMLAGHTHGGQVCLPGGKPIMTHDSLPRRFASGVHRVDETWLVVSRGFGHASLPIRLFCPSEIVELVLRRAIA